MPKVFRKNTNSCVKPFFMGGETGTFVIMVNMPPQAGRI
jgi:hypothetical protein